jgi:hypothetical protein
LIFNLGGYFCAPVVSAAVMDYFGDELVGMVWGFRVCLWWSFFGIIFIICAWICAAVKFEHYQQFHDEGHDRSPFDYDDNELTIPEL